MTEIGQTAADFTLQNQNDQPVSLSSLRGSWIVLYFYPRDDTPGCTVEACEFTDSLARFQGLNARVLGVSPDSPASHAKFIAKHKLQIELLSDPQHSLMENYGAWGEKSMYGKKSMGVIRSTVVIDPAGRIAKRWPKVQAAGHAAEVASALASLQGAAPAPATPAASAPALPTKPRAAKKPTSKPEAPAQPASKAQATPVGKAKASPKAKPKVAAQSKTKPKASAPIKPAAKAKKAKPAKPSPAKLNKSKTKAGKTSGARLAKR